MFVILWSLCFVLIEELSCLYLEIGSSGEGDYYFNVGIEINECNMYLLWWWLLFLGI